jgi:hypothetical protein
MRINSRLTGTVCNCVLVLLVRVVSTDNKLITFVVGIVAGDEGTIDLDLLSSPPD